MSVLNTVIGMSMFLFVLGLVLLISLSIILFIIEIKKTEKINKQVMVDELSDIIVEGLSLYNLTNTFEKKKCIMK